MRLVRVLVVWATSVALLGIGLGTSGASAAPPSASWSLLYAVAGDTATFDPLGADRYRVTMRGTDAMTTWFTDRPVRRTGVLPTAGLVGGWRAGGDASFARNPPNVALVAHDPQAGIETVIGIMSVPRWEPRSQTLAFTLRVLGSEAFEGETSRVSTHLLNAHDPSGRPLALSAVSLFIDDATLTCSAVEEEIKAASFEQARIGTEQNRLNAELTSALATLNAMTPDRPDDLRYVTDGPGANPLTHTDVLVVRPAGAPKRPSGSSPQEALGSLRSASTVELGTGGDSALLQRVQEIDARLAQLRVGNEALLGLLDLLTHQRGLACNSDAR